MSNKEAQTQQYIINVPPSNHQKQSDLPQVPFFDLFRFATKTDYILMTFGSLCACALGTAIPLLVIFWGNVTDIYGNLDKMVDETKHAMFNALGIAAGALLTGWGMFGCWVVAAERQGIACRKYYLRSLLRQEIGWFDTINQLELSSKFVNDTSAFQGAISEKVCTIIMTISTLITSLIIAFIKGWLMALVTLACLPAIILGSYLYAFAISKKDSELQNDYTQAGALAEQAIFAIKTVKQLNGEQFEANRYKSTLNNVTKNAKKYGIYIGVGIGSVYCTIFFSYGLSFWFGSNCVEDNSSCPSSLNDGHPYTAGNVLTILFCVLQAGFNFLQFAPAIKKISQGRSAAARIFQIIDRKSLVVSPPNAIKPEQFKGIFCFENVTFAYPKDPSYPIISNLSLKINCKSAAFVGESGCGKSTIFQLMMRFYDPDQGRITLDGFDLHDLDLQWLRRQIGYVGQEPFLFSGTIRENLLLGKEDATQEEMYEVLRKAEAYDFVYSLKDKLETYTGIGGNQISGGQKQRLAIARTLLKDPKILLLDEATSALDRHNEKNIQQTLDKIAEEKSTITIAHNVKTIMNCKEIFVINNGCLKQAGRFKELEHFKDYHLIQSQGDSFSNQDNLQVQVSKYNPEIENKANASAIQNHDEHIPIQIELDEETKNSKREQQLLEKYEKCVFSRLFSYSMHRKLLLTIGLVVTMCNGMVFPAIGIIFARILVIFIKYSDNPQQARSESNLYSLMFVILGAIYLILCIIQQTIIATIGEEITQKLRGQAYSKILKMPISWFELRHNNSLSSRLASECKSVNSITTTYISIIVQSISNLLAGLTIAFFYQWHTALVAVGLIPLTIIAGALHMEVGGGLIAKTQQIYKDSSALITESIVNIRTIHSLAHQSIILQKYSQKLKLPLEISKYKGNISGILFGFTQCIMYVTFSLVLYLGAIFLRDNNLAIIDIFTAAYAILFMGVDIGNSAHFMPDMVAAKKAAANIFSILDEEDEDQLQVKSQSRLLKTPIKGHIEFKNVNFKYESRKQQIFQNLSFEIEQGLKVGFIGASGCGKSTIHQLLQRFYDPCAGEIVIDGVKIADYDIHHLRASLGFVSQEPTLFNDTIANNIKYNRQATTHQEIVQAAKESNFNPEDSQVDADGRRGFEKNVGVKGLHVSGGQKQRLAIARMIIRRPNVLLLDQATSALDSANERRVQAFLDCIMENNTSVVIAHRLETIKNSDSIFLFDKGTIVQKGSYEQLMNRKGMFYQLEKGKICN